MAKRLLLELDKRIMNHLLRGGSLRDLAGKQLVAEIVAEGLKCPSLKQAMVRNHFHSNDLCLVYDEMVESLMPNPCVRAGRTLLVASLQFIEEVRMETFLDQMGQIFPSNLPYEERRMALMLFARKVASTTWYSHTEARGEALFGEDLDGHKMTSTSSARTS